MKSRYLERVEICDFRGFPGPQTHVLDLGGKHLLLYGENGSGKTSIFQAFSQLLNLSSDALPFNDVLTDPRCLKNRFSSPSFTKGHVTLGFHKEEGSASVPDMSWHINEVRPQLHPLFTSMARALGCLDYRAVLRTNFLHESDRGINLFSLLVNTLLREIEVPTSTATFGEVWDGLKADGTKYIDDLGKNPSEIGDIDRQGYNLEVPQEPEEDDETDDEKPEIPWESLWESYLTSQREKLQDQLRNFNRALTGRISEIEDKANEFISKFDPSLRISFIYETALKEPADETDKVWMESPQLWLTATYNGNTLEHPALVLNEARLTAIAIAVYLAALKVETPESAGKSVDFPRLLVLDDVLIGLDMANRVPVLNLIQQEFVLGGWQVFLMTFDRAWYEMAKQRIREGQWVFAELYTVRVGDYEKPVLVNDLDHLKRALDFLSKGEVKAAAVHVRTEFELILKKACQELKIPVRYDPNPAKVAASEMWNAFKSATFKYSPDPIFCLDSKGNVIEKPVEIKELHYIEKEMVARIEHSISWILNKLVHSESVDRYRREIDEAVFVVDELRNLVNVAIDGDLNQLFHQREQLLRILKYIVEDAEKKEAEEMGITLRQFRKMRAKSTT